MSGRPKFILARSDGEPITGDYLFYSVDTIDEWAGAEAVEQDAWRDVPVHYVMLRIDPVPVARRTFFPSGSST